MMTHQERLDNVERRFTYYPPKNDKQKAFYEGMRAQARNLAKYIIFNCPDAHETSMALEKLEESVMWANASMARNT